MVTCTLVPGAWEAEVGGSPEPRELKLQPGCQKDTLSKQSKTKMTKWDFFKVFNTSHFNR